MPKKTSTPRLPLALLACHRSSSHPPHLGGSSQESTKQRSSPILAVLVPWFSLHGEWNPTLVCHRQCPHFRSLFVAVPDHTGCIHPGAERRVLSPFHRVGYMYGSRPQTSYTRHMDTSCVDFYHEGTFVCALRKQSTVPF